MMNQHCLGRNQLTMTERLILKVLNITKMLLNITTNYLRAFHSFYSSLYDICLNSASDTDGASVPSTSYLSSPGELTPDAAATVHRTDLTNSDRGIPIVTNVERPVRDTPKPFNISGRITDTIIFKFFPQTPAIRNLVQPTGHLRHFQSI